MTKLYETAAGAVADIAAGATLAVGGFGLVGVGTPVADGMPWRYDAGGGVALASPPKHTREFDGRFAADIWGRRYSAECRCLRWETWRTGWCPARW